MDLLFSWVKKKGIACHECKILLEYSINEPNNIKQVNWEDKEFLVEVRTWSEIENFDFNWLDKNISFEINGTNQFVTTVIPLELLWKPYTILLDEERIPYHEFINNGTHVWLSMRPETSGEITIIGTTVIPEYPKMLMPSTKRTIRPAFLDDFIVNLSKITF